MKTDQPWSRLPNAVFAEDMPPSAFKLLCFLFRRSDESGRCFPSYRDMAKHAHLSCDSTIKKYLDLLESRGWIIGRKRRFHTSTLYVLAIPERLAIQRKKPDASKVVKLFGT